MLVGIRCVRCSGLFSTRYKIGFSCAGGSTERRTKCEYVEDRSTVGKQQKRERLIRGERVDEGEGRVDGREKGRGSFSSLWMATEKGREEREESENETKEERWDITPPWREKDEGRGTCAR